MGAKAGLVGDASIAKLSAGAAIALAQEGRSKRRRKPTDSAFIEFNGRAPAMNTCQPTGP